MELKYYTILTSPLYNNPSLLVNDWNKENYPFGFGGLNHDGTECIWAEEQEVYLKKDVDEAIAELKARAEKEARHYKYKRCLAMAKWCRESLRVMRTYEVTEDIWNLEPGQDAEYFCKKGDFYSKWRKRWLGLSYKFKEADK